MSRRWGLIVAAVLLLSAAGAGLWTWFLAHKTLEVADQWSSVLTGVATILLAPAGFVVGVVALRSSGQGQLAPPPQQPANRTQIVQAGEVSAPIINGDGNQVNR
jgi:hypothetical protein